MLPVEVKLEFGHNIQRFRDWRQLCNLKTVSDCRNRCRVCMPSSAFYDKIWLFSKKVLVFNNLAINELLKLFLLPVSTRDNFFPPPKITHKKPHFSLFLLLIFCNCQASQKYLFYFILLRQKSTVRHVILNRRENRITELSVHQLSRNREENPGMGLGIGFTRKFNF